MASSSNSESPAPAPPKEYAPPLAPEAERGIRLMTNSLPPNRTRPRVIRMKRKTIFGKPLLKISTCAIESSNRTFRLHVRRLARQQCTHSKRQDALESAILLFQCYYNLCKIHSALDMSPAMAARLTDHIWELPEMITEMEKTG